MTYTHIQKASIGFLLLAGLVGCNTASRQTSATKIEALIAKKENLIHGLAEDISQLYLFERELSGEELHGKKEATKRLCRLLIAGICGCLERKELNNIDEDIKEFNNSEAAGLLYIHTLHSFLLVDGVVEGDNFMFKEHIIKAHIIEAILKQDTGSLDNLIKEMVEPIINQAYDKIKDLAKTMKEIRELS